MAWLEIDQRTGHFKVGFRLGDRKLKRSLKTSDPSEADDALAVVNDTLRAVERGWVSIPSGVDVGQFLLSGGRLTATPDLPQSMRLCTLFDSYFDGLPEGSLEQSTIDGMKIHQRHLYRILGKPTADPRSWWQTLAAGRGSRRRTGYPDRLPRRSTTS
jgi:hypothetical protein